MNDKLLEWAIKIQSIAQSGLAYCKDVYDKERYEELRNIAAEIISQKTDISVEKAKGLFCSETGYQTPKIDTRAAVFQNGKILMVHENNGMWSLPGGWCDVDQSVASNIIKEVKEETGLSVSVKKLIAVQDWRKHNVCNYIYGVIKVFMMCNLIGGTFAENIETTEIQYFNRDELPNNIATEKTTKEQILMCFDAYENKYWNTQFD